MKSQRVHGHSTGRLRTCRVALALCVCSGLLIQFAVADRSPGYTVTGPSEAHVQRKSDGSYKIQAQESRFWLTHDYRRQARFSPRLITTTTNWSWDGDEQYSVLVTIDELRGRTTRQIAKFSDPGTTGQILAGDVYYLTQQPPCCADTGHYYFRSVDTGAFLFSATGNGDVGTTAFLYVHAPGTHVETDRWVGFEGNAATDSDPTLLGDIRYGDLKGVLSDVEIRVKSDAPPWPRSVGDWDELEAAKECSFVQWLEAGKPRSSFGRKRPAAGGCDLKSEYQPEPFTSLAGNTHPTAVSGIELEYSIAGEVYATIPIVNDHLDVDHAQLASRIALVTIH